ncbi:unnamed protein product [Paramecium pentaurelia]|uniref:Uncharacterized protein n=1 Tax=Paramecium pentaurelia TaxID=43138 RepID=A0A8S1SIP7_9CILI|nr:unnamed protein product [Paramecium pentaurelia]
MSILQTNSEKISCKAENEYCVAEDLNTKGQRDVNVLCIKCIIEQLSNKKITLIDDTKRLICQMKTQKIENQQKKNEKRREIFKNFLSQIKEFKLTVDVAFDKMTSFIQYRFFYIQKEIESLQYEGKNNYLEDLTEQSRIYSEQRFDNGIKIQEDNKIIEEIEKQFETLFNTPQYFQLNQTINNTRSLSQEPTEATVLIQPIQPYCFIFLTIMNRLLLSIFQFRSVIAFQLLKSISQRYQQRSLFIFKQFNQCVIIRIKYIYTSYFLKCQFSHFIII